MISATGGRFPPAWLQPLPPLRPGSSAHAIPVGAAGQQDVGHAIVATNVFDGTS
ncbi:hypothetical protein X953_18090 [Virgibacillus sp. SK37]|nr:hypothetical protein X953_18090 [Virgibacillus sp. SK37]